MEDTNYPRPVSDPGANGIPEYADDDSTAYDGVLSPRVADGPDPAPLPPDRDDGPLGMDEYGNTAEEQRHGEPMELRLAREEPETSPEVNPGEVIDQNDPDPGPDEIPLELMDQPVDPRLDSPVSMYDRDEPGLPSSARVGRLV